MIKKAKISRVRVPLRYDVSFMTWSRSRNFIAAQIKSFFLLAAPEPIGTTPVFYIHYFWQIRYVHNTGHGTGGGRELQLNKGNQVIEWIVIYNRPLTRWYWLKYKSRMLFLRLLTDFTSCGWTQEQFQTRKDFTIWTVYDYIVAFVISSPRRKIQKSAQTYRYRRTFNWNI